jgi:Flp pilus assembly protein TadG
MRLISLRSRRQRTGGQGLAEFALVFPITMLLFMAMFDFGRAIYGLNAVGNAAREGVRTAMVNQNWSDIRQRAADQATALGMDSSLVACDASNVPTTDTGVCVRIDGPDGTVGSCVDAQGNAIVAYGCIAEVTTKWTFTAITPFVSAFVGQKTFASTSKQPVESVCSGSCPTR